MNGLVIVVLCGLTATAAAQQASPARFEVAPIKLDPKQDRGGGQSISEVTLTVVRVLPGGRVESYGHTLRHLIAWAYNINRVPQEVVGKQDLLEMEFNISARAAVPDLTPAEARAMFRTLLEERFQLRGRLQPREVDGYLLMPAREDGQPGRGLRSFPGDCDARANNPVVRFDNPDFEQQRRCGWSAIVERHRAVGVSMKDIADRLWTLLRAPVYDRTRWPGLFTFDIRADINDMPQTLRARATLGGTPPLVDAPPLLEVFRSELGLNLVKERTTINDFVVERVEPLIEN